MLIESLHSSSYVMEIVIFALSVTIYEIFAIKMCMPFNLKLYNDPMSNENMPIESLYMTSYLITIYHN